MKRFWKGLAVLAALTLIFLGWAALTPSEWNTIALLAKHQDEIGEFLAMVQTESKGFKSIYAGDGTDGQVEGFLADEPMAYRAALPELQSAWKHLRRRWFTSFECDFAENGAMRAALNREGEWIAYEEGHYRYSDTLIWQDADWPEAPGEYWRPLTEEDGIVVSADGTWYYAYEKHDDG